MKKSFLFILLLLVAYSSLSQSNQEEILYFYSESCEHCLEVKEHFFPVLREKFGDKIIIKEFEIEEELDNYEKLLAMEEEYGDEGNEIPVAFVGERVFDGEEIEEQIIPYLNELIVVGEEPVVQEESVVVEDNVIEEGHSIEQSPQKRYPVTMAFFWEPGCQHCQRVTYDLKLLKEKHPNIIVRDWNIKEEDAKLMAEALSLRLNVPEKLHMATPALFLGDTALINEQISYKSMNEAIKRLEQVPGLDTVWNITDEELAKANEIILSRFQGLQLLPVLAAGLLDGVNPCAFGAIIFFVTFLTVVERKKKDILAVGLAFAISVFLTYLLVGMGFLRFLQALPFLETIARWVYIATGVLAIILGILSIVDFFKSRKGKFGDMFLQLPDKLKKRIHRTIISENEPRSRRNFIVAAASTGFFVSILELACTGQVYLPTIIYVMGAPGLKAKAYLYLALYNIMFIVPLLIVFGVVYYGTTSQQLTGFLKKNTPYIKLATAAIFFTMAFFLWKTVLIG